MYYFCNKITLNKRIRNMKKNDERVVVTNATTKEKN